MIGQIMTDIPPPQENKNKLVIREGTVKLNDVHGKLNY
jgi:hypothetical protein